MIFYIIYVILLLLQTRLYGAVSIKTEKAEGCIWEVGLGVGEVWEHTEESDDLGQTDLREEI